MWLITPIGFFSVVQKPADAAAGTLTIRARVRADLDALRAHYLPGMGAISESPANDYRFRAVAPRAEVAAAMAAMVNALDYSNFKSRVAKVQGAARAHLYHDVWDVLYRLQSDSKKFTTVAPTVKPGVVLHPRKDDQGRPVELKKPSKASPLEAWHQVEAVACVVPGGDMPVEVNGIPVKPWAGVPDGAAEWEALAAGQAVPEPEFKVPAGYNRRSTGVVMRERNGRVWVVAPSNAFGGYKVTFPKGAIEPGMSAQATALAEAFQESGLQARLVRHLVDVKRSQSYTRYYLAERMGGNPSDMGWESQAVMLVPEAQLPQLLNSPYDLPILEALRHVGGM